MSDENPILITTDAPDKEIIDIISAGLNSFNDEIIGINDRHPLAVIAKDPATGEILGGLTGRTSLGLLFLDLFYIPAAHRGSGLGSRILQMAEEEGRKRGCKSAVLYTISFQAPGFYERNGWRRFGEIPCKPEGTSRIFMAKDL
ncbi:GNAT family N-acetyltransferase [Pseudochrobactrum kiredjianiae]|uniref:GNAT family N-acetyltransferase n=1 Tax=Pseudochrobactrum kiredjianiae TaxID=386305 RepID=A0ABW3V6W2_9HYPH|nr:GNAT family N-acetyltransferase [Pseudochrobactrum kiredjianiae]MDM7849735.1 GNAT family N-acetyltransferase [Pseudochrobactrum kiredjianiae]